jgi:hypothetical protein
MESLKKIGELCKTHYEKLILIVALIILGVAVGYLYLESQKEKEKIGEFFSDVGRRSNKPVPPANLTNYQAMLAVAQNPAKLDFTSPHNLFNPVKWKRLPDGGLLKEVKGTEGTLDQLDILDIRALNFVIVLDRVAGPGYWINITNEVAPANARRIAQFATVNPVNTNTKVFVLREVKGPPEEPSELVLELKETGERISISRDKPYVRADAYEADLRFRLDNKNFLRQRVGATLRLGSDEFKIIGINPNEISFLQVANEKRYTKRREATPANPAANTGGSTGGGGR